MRSVSALTWCCSKGSSAGCPVLYTITLRPAPTCDCATRRVFERWREPRLKYTFLGIAALAEHGPRALATLVSTWNASPGSSRVAEPNRSGSIKAASSETGTVLVVVYVIRFGKSVIRRTRAAQALVDSSGMAGVARPGMKISVTCSVLTVPEACRSQAPGVGANQSRGGSGSSWRTGRTSASRCRWRAHPGASSRRAGRGRSALR